MSGDRSPDAIRKELTSLAKKCKEKLEESLRRAGDGLEPDPRLDSEIHTLQAQIESLGYSVTLFAILDKSGKVTRTKLVAARMAESSPHTLH